MYTCLDFFFKKSNMSKNILACHELALNHWSRVFEVPFDIYKLIFNYLKIDFVYQIPHQIKSMTNWGTKVCSLSLLFL